MYSFLILSNLVTPKENLNIFSSATSSSDSCLFLSDTVSKPYSMAALTTVLYTFPLILTSVQLVICLLLGLRHLPLQRRRRGKRGGIAAKLKLSLMLKSRHGLDRTQLGLGSSRFVMRRSLEVAYQWILPVTIEDKFLISSRCRIPRLRRGELLSQTSLVCRHFHSDECKVCIVRSIYSVYLFTVCSYLVCSCVVLREVFVR
ncbi:hypothetical protein QTP70_011846 [Hemibagrus guttatus]|uniref:Uncharacterized protein n=1 Tax=Hemibagrus guttatus TaxID=175788 RepID=A0AAE0UNX8_9TELE|nr:hypothetical protein QTP70_011846 [Hemibagrus guttatus]